MSASVLSLYERDSNSPSRWTSCTHAEHTDTSSYTLATHPRRKRISDQDNTGAHRPIERFGQEKTRRRRRVGVEQKKGRNETLTIDNK